MEYNKEQKQANKVTLSSDTKEQLLEVAEISVSLQEVVNEAKSKVEWHKSQLEFYTMQWQVLQKELESLTNQR